MISGERLFAVIGITIEMMVTILTLDLQDFLDLLV